MRVRMHPSVCEKAGTREERGESEEAAQGRARADVVTHPYYSMLDVEGSIRVVITIPFVALSSEPRWPRLMLVGATRSSRRVAHANCHGRHVHVPTGFLKAAANGTT